MPRDVSHLVMKQLEYVNRRSVDKTEICFDRIMYQMKDGFIELDMDGHTIRYDDDENGGTTVSYDEHLVHKRQHEDGNFVELALKDLKIVLKHASSYFFNNDTEDSNKSFIDLLKSENGLPAKKVTLLRFAFNDLFDILPCFDALEDIELWYISSIDQFQRIASLEQWKKTKRFCIEDHLFDNEQIELFFHFEVFGIDFDKFSVQNAVKVRDDLLRRSTFQSCGINFKESGPVEIAKLFKLDYVGGETFEMEYSNKNGKFEVSIDENLFSVERL
ncbi:DUF38 domain-containing protein [Caenorhabditis elegans]|uniref:DUF38 domain-containing protein n=1 Tax=Caenorhabditis elegans TaxID=6239 RepID=O44889_CAEEL|nr:DUF38 domain-containing protein [Caenorhabditis elegans]CCD67062.2 DUF38 domain-containing protein [Caenorhabditis elegans]|eukprot:NP_497526.2 F-box A protein [Caenorhabditis elegans]